MHPVVHLASKMEGSNGKSGQSPDCGSPEMVDIDDKRAGNFESFGPPRVTILCVTPDGSDNTGLLDGASNGGDKDRRH